MSDPRLSFRIKLILTVALLAVVTAFGVTFLRGEASEKAARDSAGRKALEAEEKGADIPF